MTFALFALVLSMLGIGAILALMGAAAIEAVLTSIGLYQKG